MSDDPLHIDANVLISRLEARYAQALRDRADAEARLINEIIRLETALAQAIASQNETVR